MINMKDYLEITIKDTIEFKTTMIKSNNPETFTVEWGDSETDVFESAKGNIDIEHTYKTKGTYTIKFNIKDVTLAENYKDSYAFLNLRNKNIISISGSLPAMKLSSYCYDGMFFRNKIEKLDNFSLPATELAPHCYRGMFNINSIKTLKGFSLPSTKLAMCCYQSMFSGNDITDLNGFVLPATKLTNSCYESMFVGNEIRSLKGFELPATELAEYCYAEMFKDNKLTELGNFNLPPLEKLRRGCYEYMFAHNDIKDALEVIHRKIGFGDDYDELMKYANGMFYGNNGPAGKFYESKSTNVKTFTQFLNERRNF